MLPEPPFPIAASYNDPGPVLVTFSTFLTPGLLDPLNWFVYENNQKWGILTAEVVSPYPNPVVELTRFRSAASIGPDRVEYLPPPFDVRSRIGDLPAPGFINFPLGP